MEKNREIWVDWMRVVACFLVMVVHSTEPFYLGGDGTLVLTKADAFWASLFDSFARVIVKPGDIRKQYALSAGMGTALLLITYLVVEYCNFGIYLPVSATMAILALPLMIFIM